MKKLSILFMGLYLILLLPSVVSGEKGDKEKKKPTFDDILEFQSPGSPIISPDGKWVLYTVSECDMEKNEYRSQIWLVDVEKKQPRQMTFVKKSNQSPRWSPDSQSFIFLSAREEKAKPQVYIMSAFGGEPRPLTESKTGVQNFKWSKNGKYIAFTAKDEKSKQDKAIEKKYGEFDVFNEKFNKSFLWVLDIQAKKAEKILDRDDLHVADFEWSPDSSQIAFTATPDPRAESFSKSDIYVVNIKDRKVRELVKQKGPDDSAVWSGDGKWIAFNSNMGVEEYFVNTRICMVPAEGGEIINLTPNFDENAYLREWRGKYLWFTAYRGMTSQIFKLDPTNKKIFKFTQAPHGNGRIIYRLSLSQQGTRIAYNYEDALQCPEIYISGTKKFTPVQLTRFSSQVKDWTLSSKEPIKWESHDGVQITGVLIKPADFDPNKKYPLLVIIHGGPTAVSVPTYLDRYGRYYPIEQWAAKGAVILEPNYRGSAGFGEKFRKLNYRDLGVGDYRDVISGVDHLVSLGFIDETRLGAMAGARAAIYPPLSPPLAAGSRLLVLARGFQTG